MIQGFFFNTPIRDFYIGHQLSEIYKELVYAPYLNDKKDLTILDIGANIGMTSYYFSQFAKVVHSFEPSSENFELLSKMIEFNKLTNVIPYKMAIAPTDGEADFQIQQNKTMHSLKPATQPTGSEKVKTMRLDTFFKEKGIEKCDFMKLDVEGMEADIICSEGFQNVASKIDIILLEVHNWMGRNPNQLMEGLRVAGFKAERLAHDAELIVAHHV